MSIVPKIICPPDYSVRCFRLVDPMSFGIVKGAQTEITIPTKGICIPVNRYDDKRLILKAGSTMKVDISGLANYGELQETYSFSANLQQYPNALSAGTKHRYSLYDESLTLIETVDFTVTTTFSVAAIAAFNASQKIKNLVSIDTGNINQGTFSIKANKAGVKYRHIFYFDLDGFGGIDPYPFLHPGNLTQKYRKYPEGRIKILLVVPEFNKVDLSTCGCADNSGLMLSNQKYFQYAFASDVERHINTLSPILVNGDDMGTTYSWSQESKDHVDYHFSTGELVNMPSAPFKRALIQSIDGYTITTDTPIGNSFQNYLNHLWYPPVSWNTGGEMNLFTGGQDVNDNDYLSIETIYLKNPQGFDIPMRILIGV